MLSILAKSSRFLLPALFFGYALAANTNLVLTGEWRSIEPSLAAVMKGEVVREVEDVYKTELPHREPSIGLLGALRYQLLGVGKPGIVVGKNEWFYTSEEFGPEINKASRLERSVEEIVRIKNRLAKDGVHLMLVPLPHKSDVYDENLPGLHSANAGRDQYTSFVQRLTQSDIPVADTRPALAHGKSEEPVFFRTDTHWTPHGANLVAQEVARSVPVVHSWEATDFQLQEADTVSFWGDLVSFVTDEDYGDLAGLEQENTRLWEAIEPETELISDLFGADSAFPVVLVGSSYSANPNWSFAEFLKAHLAVDVLNVAEEGQGPGTPMFKYLESDEFADEKPVLVIWEFPTRYLAQDLLWEAAPASKDPSRLALQNHQLTGETIQ